MASSLARFHYVVSATPLWMGHLQMVSCLPIRCVVLLALQRPRALNPLPTCHTAGCGYGHPMPSSCNSGFRHGSMVPTPHSCFLGLLLLPRGLFLDSFSHLRFLLPWFSQDRSWWETSPLAIPSWPLHCQELWFSYWHEFCKGMAEWLTPPWLHHHDWLSGICLHRGVYIEIPFYNSSKAFLYFYSYNYPTTSAERIFLIKQMKNWNPREITLTAHFLVYFLVLSAVYS